MARELKKILIVEDDDDIRMVARMTLAKLGGFEIADVEGGLEALAAAQSFRPDLILLDVMMPNVDGPETFRRLKGIPGYEVPPVVFLTAKVQTDEIKRYLDLGAIGVISKPFDPTKLADEVKAVWMKQG